VVTYYPSRLGGHLRSEQGSIRIISILRKGFLKQCESEKKAIEEVVRSENSKKRTKKCEVISENGNETSALNCDQDENEEPIIVVLYK